VALTTQPAAKGGSPLPRTGEGVGVRRDTNDRSGPRICLWYH